MIKLKGAAKCGPFCIFAVKEVKQARFARRFLGPVEEKFKKFPVLFEKSDDLLTKRLAVCV